MGRLDREPIASNGMDMVGGVEVPLSVRGDAEMTVVNSHTLQVPLKRFLEDNGVAFNAKTTITRNYVAPTGQERTIYTIVGPTSDLSTIPDGRVFSALPESAMNAINDTNLEPPPDYFGDIASEREGPPPEEAEPIKKRKPRWPKESIDS